MNQTYYISIGNSDDKLRQSTWADFIIEVLELVADVGHLTHGVWHSEPVSAYQNMCVCFEAMDDDMLLLRKTLSRICRKYKQDAIALATAQTELVRP